MSAIIKLEELLEWLNSHIDGLDNAAAEALTNGAMVKEPAEKLLYQEQHKRRAAQATDARLIRRKVTRMLQTEKEERAYTFGYNDGHVDEEDREDRNPYSLELEPELFTAYEHGYAEGSDDW